MTGSMKAAVLRRTGQPLIVESRPLPDAAAGLVLEVVSCGVCHTDLHLAGGSDTAVPLVLGHEMVVTDRDEEPALVYPTWGCGRCRHCRRGDEAMCAEVTIPGVHVDGGFASAVAIPDESYLYPLDGIDPARAGPLADAAATSYRAVRRGLPADRAVVIGVDGLGQFAVQWLRLLGGCRVTAVDPEPRKRERAIELGAAQAVPPDAGLDPFPLVLDFVGSGASLALGGEVVDREGTIVTVGGAGGSLPVGMEAIPYEAWVTTSIMGSRSDVEAVLGHATRGEVEWEVETVSLDDANTALDRLRAGDVAGRLALIPGG